MVARHAGRRGRPWRRCQATVLERDGGICHICDHPGAGEADHYPITLKQLRLEGLDPNNPDYSRAAHGSNSPCPYCPPRRGKPRYCNQERGQGINTAKAEAAESDLVW